MLRLFFVAASAALVLLSCSKDDYKENPYRDLEKISYEYTDELFPNPERGFLTHKEISSTTSKSVITDKIFETERFFNRSLTYIIYYMPDFMECDISQEFLDLIRGNMQQIRKNGFKCVLRFAYKKSWTALDHPWDPTEEVVHRHIDQLAPILQEYSDVIFCLEAGFIGVYGEWYYTDNFHYNPFKDEHFEPRRRLIHKLLDVLPANRQIAVRYPEVKLKMFNKEIADSVNIHTAHDGSDFSRIAHHNDCFVSSSNDVGTYGSNEERQYVYTETRYTVWGGESCAVVPFGTCDKSVVACENHHMSYLNNSYHQGVLARWRSEGCYEEIDRRMGYRLYFKRAYFDRKALAGQPYRVVLEIFNEGFAPPINPRGAELVLVGADGKKTVTPLEGVDPRFWFDGVVSTVDVNLTLPSVPGDYDLYLNLPDPEPTLKGNPAYSIRLANKDVWDAQTGYNKVRTITVQ